MDNNKHNLVMMILTIVTIIFSFFSYHFSSSIKNVETTIESNKNSIKEVREKLNYISSNPKSDISKDKDFNSNLLNKVHEHEEKIQLLHITINKLLATKRQ